MARERDERIRQFMPSASCSDLYHEAVDSGEVSSVDEYWLNRLNRDYLKSWLNVVFAQNQGINNDWAEEKFAGLRDARNEWSVDGMLVDNKGQIIGSAVWSTYGALRNNAELQFSMSHIIQSIKRRSELVFPISPKLETVLFWKSKDSLSVLPVIRERAPNAVVEDYSSEGEVIQMSRVKRSVLGAGQFARSSILLGKVGFWESNKLRMGNFGHEVYVQRVVFRDSSILPDGAYISPLDPGEVKERGGRLMEDKYPQVRIIRIDPGQAQEDFIATSLAAESPVPGVPVVLSYTTPRVWLDELPKHSSGRSGFEPQIPHE